MSDKSTKDWKKFQDADEPMGDETIEQAKTLSTEDAELSEFDDSIEELEHLSYEALEQKLKQADQLAHDNWDKATRALAELDNVRRRAEREVAQAHKYSLERFVDGILPVVDSLEQALQLVDEHADQAMHEGLALTMKLFLSVLSKFQVEQLDPMGQSFNPQEHEAMSMQDSDSPSSSVVMVFQKGYKLNDRLIRPARVVVAK